jgi:hypothetical protein
MAAKLSAVKSTRVTAGFFMSDVYGDVAGRLKTTIFLQG